MKNPVLLTVENFSYAFPEVDDFVLHRINLVVGPGEVHCITGPTGCGKTTLLMAIRGLLPPGIQQGRIVAANPTGAEVTERPPGIVMQNPLTQLLGANLGADVAFGLENHCVASQKMPGMVRTSLYKVGLHQPLNTTVTELSLGQQYRACLAGVLVMGTRLVLLDEPGAHLDPMGIQQLREVILKLKSRGNGIVICDHQPGTLGNAVDYHWEMTSQGQLIAALGVTHRTPPRPLKDVIMGVDTAAQHDSKTNEVIRVRDLKLFPDAGNDKQPLCSFCVASGEHVMICGPNGSGKTSLIRCLLGLQSASSGSIDVYGASPRSADLRCRVGVLFQNPTRQLFHTTVFEEVTFAARRKFSDQDEAVHRALDAMARLGISHLKNLSPHKLSYGQKQLVLIAAAVSSQPELLILDDPLAGLDAEKTGTVLAFLRHLNQVYNTTIIQTSHNIEKLDGPHMRVIRLNSMAESVSYFPHSPLIKKRATAGDAWVPLPAGLALVAGICLSMAAFAARSLSMLLILTLVNLSMLVLGSNAVFVVLRQSFRIFIWQSVFICLLYALRFGWHSGYTSGLQVAWQLFLAFWPGIILMSTTSHHEISRTLGRFLPYQAVFVASTCLRFVPLLVEEMKDIRNGQIFRGAGLLKKDLIQPRFWLDWLHCLIIPTLVRTLSLSRDISLAAAARDFGFYEKRTYWPGDDTSCADSR